MIYFISPIKRNQLKPINKMSFENNIHLSPINLSYCFSCEKPNSPTANCSCGFNVDTVCEKFIELCKSGVIQSITTMEFVIGSFTLKHIKKILSKLGYIYNITIKEGAKACAIEFAMRSGIFTSGYYNIYQDAMTSVNASIHPMREDNQEARTFMWNSVIKDSRVLMPPLIGGLTQKIYRSKLMYARHIQNELERGRYRLIELPSQMRLLPDDVTVISVRIMQPRPVDINVQRERIARQQRLEAINRTLNQAIDEQLLNQAQSLERANALSMVTLQAEREKQIADNKVKTWKSISIKSNVLQKNENQEAETCPICQDDVIHSKKTKTSCGHTLCSDCISDTITKCGATCILCRSIITSIEFGSIEEIVKCQDVKIQIISS